jgi:hypothetical protein
VHDRRRVIAAALGFPIGVGLLLAGVVINVVLIAVAGFVVALACSLWAVSYQRVTGITTGRADAPASRRDTGRWDGWTGAGGVADSATPNAGLPAAVPLTPTRRCASFGEVCGCRAGGRRPSLPAWCIRRGAAVPHPRPNTLAGLDGAHADSFWHVVVPKSPLAVPPAAALPGQHMVSAEEG